MYKKQIMSLTIKWKNFCRCAVEFTSLQKNQQLPQKNHHVTPFSAITPYQITPTYFLQEVCPSRNSENVVLSYSTSVVTDSMPTAGPYIYPMRSPAQTIGGHLQTARFYTTTATHSNLSLLF